MRWSLVAWRSDSSFSEDASNKRSGTPCAIFTEDIQQHEVSRAKTYMLAELHMAKP